MKEAAELALDVHTTKSLQMDRNKVEYIKLLELEKIKDEDLRVS